MPREAQVKVLQGLFPQTQLFNLLFFRHRWWVEDDGKVVEFTSEAEVVEYCESLETPLAVM